MAATYSKIIKYPRNDVQVAFANGVFIGLKTSVLNYQSPLNPPYLR